MWLVAIIMGSAVLSTHTSLSQIVASAPLTWKCAVSPPYCGLLSLWIWFTRCCPGPWLWARCKTDETFEMWKEISEFGMWKECKSLWPERVGSSNLKTCLQSLWPLPSQRNGSAPFSWIFTGPSGSCLTIGATWPMKLSQKSWGSFCLVLLRLSVWWRPAAMNTLRSPYPHPHSAWATSHVTWPFQMYSLFLRSPKLRLGLYHL